MNGAVRVHLTPADMRLARQWSDEVLANGIDLRPNPTGLSRPDRYFTGYVGELAYGAWSDTIDALYRYRVNLCGASDDPEYVVWVRRHASTLDVKTASLRTHRKMGVPVKQKLDAELYVAARILNLADGEVELSGWLSRDEVSALPLEDLGGGCLSRCCELVDMRAMDDLAAILDRRRVIVRNARAAARPQQLEGAIA